MGGRAAGLGDDAEDPGRVQGGGFRGGEVRGDEDRGAVEGELLPISWTEKISYRLVGSSFH